MTLECIELRLDHVQLCQYLDLLDKSGVPYGFTVDKIDIARGVDLLLHVDGCDADLRIRLHDGRWSAFVHHPVIEMVAATKKENPNADS